ncbi:MAG: glycoside-pentoside-hexuronide (GPH):cation symporter [Tannerellaceae bacterium]|jgi:GPH family glycoside/pentoside/hexuronide:cation symporter|nr:glycoside-pentoside-hexuronide (GPH):cation symporter [Tannerellaceae bacterium]
MGMVSLREKIAYGLGDAASSIFWKLFTVYLLFFYTDVFGLEASLAGTMFFITRIWNALLDPVVGVMADRTETRWGKFRPYLLYLAIPFGIMGVVTFTVPALSPAGKVVYAYVSYSLMMAVYSLINVPYAALLGVISPASGVRTALSSYRMIFAFAGSLVVLLLIEPLVGLFGGGGSGGAGGQAFGWQMGVGVFAAVAAGLFFLCFRWTTERVRPVEAQKPSLRQDLRGLLGDRAWWLLLAAGAATLAFHSVRDGAVVYYFKYVVSGSCGVDLPFTAIPLTLTTLYLVIGQGANIVGIILVNPLSKRIGKKNSFLLAMLFATAFNVAFFFMGEGDIVPIMCLQALISLCAGVVAPLLWAMCADVADHAEWKTGRRATGLIFSSVSMSQKVGWSIGGALTGWLLAYYGFQANTTQTDAVLYGIRLMLSFFPAMATLLAAAFICRYPLR